MDKTEIRKRSLNKFNTDAINYENTSDGRFCSRVYPAVLEEISAKPFASLLDVGCGTGIILSRITIKSKLCGIDLCSQMISRAKETLKDRAELVVGDAESLPWKARTFDTVCCTFSFHHYPNPEKVLSEMNRVLRDNGRLIIADPCAPLPLQQILNLSLHLLKGGDFHIYSKHEMKQLLIKTGFDLKNFRHPTHDSFLLAAQKTGGIQNA